MKFEKLELNYIKNLLHNVFGNGRLIGDLGHEKCIHGYAVFEERLDHDKEGVGSIFFDLKKYEPSKTPGLISENNYNYYQNRCVISIHGIVEENEHKHLFTQNKIVRRLLIEVRVSPNIIYYANDEEVSSSLRFNRDAYAKGFLILQTLIERKYEKDLKNYSGMDVRFEFKKVNKELLRDMHIR